MKKTFLSALFLLMFGLHINAQQKESKKPELFQPSALIEVFSSEGCSSCPFADTFMGEVLQISDSGKAAVYVIDYHVDIWNRSGWVDPFSDSNYSLRQQHYVLTKKWGANYTPMAVINGGNKDFGGGDRPAIGRKIQETLNKPSFHFLRTGVAPIENEDSIAIGYQIWGNTDSTTINAVLVQRVVKNLVTAGENKDKVLEHHNVARKMITMPIKESKGVIKMGITRDLDMEKYRLIVFVQHKRTLEIFCADQLSF